VNRHLVTIVDPDGYTLMEIVLPSPLAEIDMAIKEAAAIKEATGFDILATTSNGVAFLLPVKNEGYSARIIMLLRVINMSIQQPMHMTKDANAPHKSPAIAR